MPQARLSIPYRSQWDSDALAHQADCGPTCVAMILNATGKAITTDGVYEFIGEKEAHEFTSFSELIGACNQNQFPLSYMRYDSLGTALHWLKQFMDEGRPVIALVKYHPWRDITGNKFSWGHFVVVVGYDDDHVYVHDPLFGLWEARTKGDGFRFTIEQFVEGWGGFDDPEENPNWACAIAKNSLTIAPAPPEPPVPEPEPEPEPPAPGEVVVTDALRKRIKGLSGYIWGQPPDFDNPAQVKFWADRLGDWGAQTTIHEVQSGETLVHVAAKYYGEQWRWPAIRLYNELAGEWVFVGQKLAVPLLGDDEAHKNPDLPANTVSFDIVGPDADFNPSQEAIDYNELGKNTAGIGFVEEASFPDNAEE